MTAAQKKAQDNFKKAIAYRKKTGCTLKQAFAHVKGGKVGAVKNKIASKKIVKKLPISIQKKLNNVQKKYGIVITKSQAEKAIFLHNVKGYGGSSVGYELFNVNNKKDSQTLGDTAIDLGRYYNTKNKVGAVKKAAKKPSEKAILKKVHSAKTTSKTLFNKLDKLDEAQHKHMGSYGVDNSVLLDFKSTSEKIEKLNKILENNKIQSKKFIFKTPFWKKYFINKNTEIKKYLSELKKHKAELKKLL